MTVKALLEEYPRPTDHEIREFLSGNFCRCAGYTLILSAVRDAAGLPTEKR
jgi:carbon-monoxide dehydrogenase small subunit